MKIISISDYLQHCTRIMLESTEERESIFVIPRSYARDLYPGKDVSVTLDMHNMDNMDNMNDSLDRQGIIFQMNVVVVQSRTCGDSFEYCLNSGGNVSTFVTQDLLDASSAHTLSMRH